MLGFIFFGYHLEPYLFAELNHFRDDLLTNVRKDGVTNELQVFTGEWIHVDLRAPD